MVEFSQAVAASVESDPRYAAEAYHFLRVVLGEALEVARRDGDGGDRHVSGPELLDAFRQLALRQFGPMAITVLEEWGIRRCEDVGEIVFNLIESGAFGRSDTDRREDFAGGYDFADAFVAPYLPASKRRRRNVCR